MKIEIESKYEVGDKVYMFDPINCIKPLEIIKIKFQPEYNSFLYLIENSNDERQWVSQNHIKPLTISRIEDIIE